MKKIALFSFLVWAISSTFAQPAATLFTTGRYIIGNCGDTIVLKGVNYAAYNWGYNPNQLRIDQIAQTGANAVRIPWYASGSPALYADYIALDSVLSKCIQADMIPILELHDQTCQNNHAAVTQLANFFTQPNVHSMLQKYKHSLILNIANEALHVNWTANPVQALQTYQVTYANIVNTLRSNDLYMPIMIDAPDCGTNIDALASVGAALIANDPQHNLIFSAHAYWYGFANNDSMTYVSKINNALAANIPIIFGEVANLQDDQQMCQYTLDYKPILSICEQHKIGWLAWSWDNDGCPQRQMTSTGNYANLTPYGQVIVNNPVYGIKNTAKKSKYLVSNNCVVSSVQAPQKVLNSLLQIENKTDELVFRNIDNQGFSLQLFNLAGQGVLNIYLAPNQTYLLNKAQLSTSLYAIRVQQGATFVTGKYGF
ncbi:MAG: glycoside hydrolase family 5 protein [Bacteroidia bacterium]